MVKRTVPAMAIVWAVLIPPARVVALNETTETLPRVGTNDNQRAAGRLQDGILVLSLRAEVGAWRPEGDGQAALRVEAFGEEGAALQVPAPLIRVSEGTEIVARVRNDLDAPLRLHGLCARDGGPCAPVEIPAAESREIRFVSGAPGTYHYWATTTGMPLPFRGATDTQLSGAFIIDPRGVKGEPDRVLVITDWTSITRDQLRTVAAADDPGAAFLALEPQIMFLVNGLSWPATERLTYARGDLVRWRVVNLSSQVHPMHLHGFYFDVDAIGNGVKDESMDPTRAPRVVTQVMQPGGTLTMTWRAERAGNWLFHCHIIDHVSPERRLEPVHHAAHAHHEPSDASIGMAGLVLGIRVLDAPGAPAHPTTDAAIAPRRIGLVMRSTPQRFGDKPAFRFALADDSNGSTPDNTAGPGPTLVLKRGEPVEIALANGLPESTSIHWHGIELESFYDGVHGWSGTAGRVTPIIEPGGRFTARLTPPRNGTFIYHTHLHDDHQLASGLYGAILVVDDPAAVDPAFDHVIVLGRGGPGADAPAVLNGARDLRVTWKAGSRHRIRFVNITPGDIFAVSLATARGPVSWQPLTKDGAPVPADSPARAATQAIAVGETYDFEYEAPPGRQTLWINVVTPAGRWEAQGHVAVK